MECVAVTVSVTVTVNYYFEQMKPGTPVGPRRGARFLLFGECGKSGRTDHRSRR